MSSFKPQGKPARPAETIYYRQYIESVYWEDRKTRYYERHAKACKICGATTNVQLNHVKYGNYGNEADRDLVPLCGDHHHKLHEVIGVRRNMHYATEHFLADEIAKYDAEHEGPVAPVKISPVAAPANVNVAIVLDRLARPIWRLLGVRK